VETRQMGKRALSGLLAGTLLLAGCATTSPDKKGDEYGVFYEGKSEATYATAFPVGTPEEAYRNGDAAAQSGDYDRALFEYIRGLDLAEEPSADALFKIGNIHYSRENYRLADLAYRWVLEINPDHGPAGTGLGLILLQRRQYAEARTQLSSVVTGSDQTSWQAYNALGILADMDGEAKQAEQYYQQALSAFPRSPLILNNLGYSRYLAGNWLGAQAALQAALRANPSYELAWRNLGLVHARQKNYDDAVQAIGRTGAQAEAYNDVGFVSMMSGDYAKALSFFEEAMRLSPAYYVTASENAKNAKRLLSRNSARADP